MPDVHVGYVVDTPTYSLGAWDIFMQALATEAERITHLIILGDFGNWESLSHWASLRAEQCYVEEDVALVDARLTEVEAITKPNGIKVVILEGNHEAWASQFEAKYPALRDSINLERRLRIKERGWTWVKENHFWAIGDLYFTHGHVRGVRSPRDMIKLMGVSVMYGHTHHYVTESLRTLTGEHAAWTMGCLASIDPPPPYARGMQPSGWVHGFGQVQVRANGLFQVGYRRIVGESYCELADGTELRVRPKEIRYRYQQDQDIRAALRREYGERYYSPGETVKRTEPHYGKTTADNATARTRRARILRMQPAGGKPSA